MCKICVAIQQLLFSDLKSIMTFKTCKVCHIWGVNLVVVNGSELENGEIHVNIFIYTTTFVF